MSDQFSKVLGTKRGHIGPVEAEPDPPIPARLLRKRIHFRADWLHRIVFDLPDTVSESEALDTLTDYLREDFIVHGYDIDDLRLARVELELEGMDRLLYSDHNWTLQVKLVGGSWLEVAFIRFWAPEGTANRLIYFYWNDEWVGPTVDISRPVRA